MKDYSEIKQRSKVWAFFYVVADVSYYVGLLGGLIGVIWFPLRWLFDWIHGSPEYVLRPWRFYVEGLFITIAVAVFLFWSVVAVKNWIHKRMEG